jgi:hypothetical protein
MYERLYKKVTPNGVTLDMCIQPSVNNTGKFTGFAAGDEESYEVNNYCSITIRRVVFSYRLAKGIGSETGDLTTE